MQKVYLDNAATTPIDLEVIETITNTMREVYGNPSSSHQFGRKAKALVEEARKGVAKHFNVAASEIIFTSGGSEADNLILRNAVVHLGVKRIITTKIEHHAVLHTVSSLKDEFNIEIDFVDLNEFGEVNYNHLEKLLQNSELKTLVSLMYINNELGNLLNLHKVCKLCKAHAALFHSDTVQAIGHYALDLQSTPIDFIVASAHKFHGPKGVGFAVIKKGFAIKPLLIGGEQERGARAGTENVHNIVGLQKALDIAMDNLEKDTNYIATLKQYFIKGLKKISPDISFNGCSAQVDQSSYITLNVRFSKNLPMLLFNLDLKGVAASGGSACQSGSNQGSHVLKAILNDKQVQNTSVRFSFSKYTTKEQLDYSLKVIKELL